MKTIKKYIWSIIFKIYNSIINIHDKIRIFWRRKIEIEKFKNPQRKNIYEKIKLTKDQKKQIDEFFLKNYWEKIPYTRHKHFTAFTGNFDYQYFPELLYIPEFEYFMNSNKEYCKVFSDKNILPLIAKSLNIWMPDTIISCTKWILRDGNYNFISKDKAIEILLNKWEVFYKPSIDSCSWNDCKIINIKNEKNSKKFLKKLGTNFVIQDIIKNHEDIAKIYSWSVNTFRIITYIWNNKVKHCPALLRIWRGGYLDNAHQWWIFIAIDDDWKLHDKAFTEFNLQFTEHPNTWFKFKWHKIKLFPNVLKAAIKMHEAIPEIGIINQDFTINQNGDPILIEWNTIWGSIRLVEMSHWKTVFWEDTAEILQRIHDMKKTKYTKRRNNYL